MEQPYKNMSPEEIYHQYDCSAWTTRPGDVLTSHIEDGLKWSDEVKGAIDCEVDVPYGNSKKQKLDIFGGNSVAKDAPIYVFIHGGYWHCMGNQYYSYIAKPLVNSGALVVFMGYDLAPDANLKEIIEMVKRAMKYIFNMAKSRGSRGIYLSGHSAGGHLSAMMLSQEWSEEEITLIKGAILMSGVFDVRPLIHYDCNDHLHLTWEEAWECSPAKYVDKLISQCQNVRFMCVVGGDESPEFKRQTQQYYELLKQGGLSVTHHVIPGRDHFDLVEKLAEPSYNLTLEIVKFLGL